MKGSSLAFLILAHTDPVQVSRLLKALPAESSKIVHIDRKTKAFNDFAPTSENTCLVYPRLETHWGAFSLVEATLACLRVGFANPNAERFILLSGQCYPIRSNNEIVSFFSTQPQVEFIKYFDMSASSSHYISKLERYYISEDAYAPFCGSYAAKVASRLSSRALRLWRRDWRGGLVPFVPAYGSQWWAVTRNCAQTFLSMSEHSALAFFKNTFAPDEMYFHTVVANSPFHRHAGGFRPFLERGNRFVSNLHLLSTSSLRKIFTLDDWDLVAGSDQLFLRKVNSTESADLVARIEADLRGR